MKLRQLILMRFSWAWAWTNFSSKVQASRMKRRYLTSRRLSSWHRLSPSSTNIEVVNSDKPSLPSRQKKRKCGKNQVWAQSKSKRTKLPYSYSKKRLKLILVHLKIDSISLRNNQIQLQLTEQEEPMLVGKEAEAGCENRATDRTTSTALQTMEKRV